MKLVVDLFNDKLKSIYKSNKIVEKRKNCYVIEVDDDFNATKFVKKGYWKQLSDSNGKLLWDESSLLKPLMGYELSKDEVEIDIFNNVDFWTIQEVLNIKYQNRLKAAEDFTHIFFEEFINLENVSTNGSLNIGKRVCFGKGDIVHNIPLKNNKVRFDCEYEGDLPKMEISIDGQKFLKIDANPYIHDFRKSIFSKVYLRFDTKHILKAYSICFNGKSSDNSKILEKI